MKYEIKAELLEQIIAKQDELIKTLDDQIKLVTNCESDFDFEKYGYNACAISQKITKLETELAALKSELSEPEKESGGNKTAEDLKMEFHHETGDPWLNSQNEPDIDYVAWLENKVINASQFQEQPIKPAETNFMQSVECPDCGKQRFWNTELVCINPECKTKKAQKAHPTAIELVRDAFRPLQMGKEMVLETGQSEIKKAQPGDEEPEMTKETFIKHNIELCNKAFKNGGAHKNWKSLNGRILIKLAREKLHYKDKTYAGDIFAHLYDIYSLIPAKDKE
jgi:hypothetical protein